MGRQESFRKDLPTVTGRGVVVANSSERGGVTGCGRAFLSEQVIVPTVDVQGVRYEPQARSSGRASDTPECYLESLSGVAAACLNLSASRPTAHVTGDVLPLIASSHSARCSRMQHVIYDIRRTGVPTNASGPRAAIVDLGSVRHHAATRTLCRQSLGLSERVGSPAGPDNPRLVLGSENEARRL